MGLNKLKREEEEEGRKKIVQCQIGRLLMREKRQCAQAVDLHRILLLMRKKEEYKLANEHAS